MIIFLVGILYTFASLVISGISGAMHLGSHVGHIHPHFDHGHAGVHPHHLGQGGELHNHNGAAAHDTGTSHTLFSILGILINPVFAVSFLTVFGGIGILGTDYFKLPGLLVAVISLLSATVVSGSLYKFIVLPIYKAENSTDISRDELLYTTAEVISPIIENGFGKIRYTVNSIRYTAPAKHINGNAIKQGDEVIIYKIENNIFYVIEYKDLNSIKP